MTTLISSIGTTSFESAGKRQLAEQLGQRLSDYLLWHTVRVGSKQPVSCGREGQAPIIIKQPTLRHEAFAGADTIQVMTMKVSKGLELPVMVLPGVGHVPAPGEDEKEAARVGGKAGLAED